MAVPLRPTEKTYRATHRASSSRGCVAWDTSYLSTIGCFGTKDCLITMLKALGFRGEGWKGKAYEKWVGGARFTDGWVFERDGKVPIAPVDVIWQAKHVGIVEVTPVTEPEMELDHAPATESQRRVRERRKKLDRRLFIRVHPSAFRQVWTELLRVARMQRPEVLLEDLRFEIGSITVTGPSSTEALAGVLRLVPGQDEIEPVWSMLRGLNNPAGLPRNAMLAFEALDPRFHHPPRQQSIPRDDRSLQRLSELLVSWPLDASLSSSQIFDYKARFQLSKHLPSQQAINRRRKSLLPGQDVEQTQNDPRIPLLILSHRPTQKKSNTQGHWTLLAPWCAIDPIWRSLMYYPLTTGGTPRFGGLEQTRQIAFEHTTPWYPGDFPGTEAGKAWDCTESEERFDAWLRRPPSRRLAWEQLDLGLGRKGEHGQGWTCDWQYLFNDADSSTSPKLEMIKKTKRNRNDPFDMTQPRYLTQKQRKAADTAQQKQQEREARRRNTSSPESDAEQATVLSRDVAYSQLTPFVAGQIFDDFTQPVPEQKPMLATIRMRYLTRGTPKAAARIYRLPSHAQSVKSSATDGATKAKDNENEAPSPPDFECLPPKFQSVADQNIQSPNLRQRWLAQVPNPLPDSSSTAKIATPLGSQRQNHHGDLAQHKKYTVSASRTLPISHIRVFPNKGPPEILSKVRNMYGPRPPPLGTQDKINILQPTALNTDDEDLWDKHIPCPDAEDLIGFVTSGGYNLTEGRGTAIGSIWTQRVIERWQAETKLDSGPCDAETSLSNTSSVLNSAVGARGPAESSTKSGTKSGTKSISKDEKRRDCERKLCIVRNAGESIGRLAVWEVC